MFCQKKTKILCLKKKPLQYLGNLVQHIQKYIYLIDIMNQNIVNDPNIF